MKVSSRPCTPQDVALLGELADAAFAEIAQWRGGEMIQALCPEGDLAGHFERFLEMPDGFARAGAIDDVPVAGILGNFTKLRQGRRLAQVQMLYVLPQARGVGVGELLITDMFDWARQQGCSGVDASALPGDRLTKNFFESQGMTARILTLYCDIGGSD